MNDVLFLLIQKAENEYGDIYPLYENNCFDINSFTIEKSAIHFWFNTNDCSTHITSYLF